MKIPAEDGKLRAMRFFFFNKKGVILSQLGFMRYYIYCRNKINCLHVHVSL